MLQNEKSTFDLETLIQEGVADTYFSNKKMPAWSPGTVTYEREDGVVF